MKQTIARLASQTSLMTKIAIPIIVIGISIGFLISQSIATLLEEHTTQSLKVESRNLNNKLFYLIEADFKALFLSYGKDAKRYEQAKKLSQQELLASLKNLFRSSIYDIAIITPQGTHWIKQSYTHDSILQSVNQHHKKATHLFDKHIINHSYFRPWKWNIVIIRDRAPIFELIAQNNTIIFQNISILVLLLIGVLIAIIYLTINRPFQKIFAHLATIAHDKEVRLNLTSSKEVVTLVESINAMSSEILTSHNQLIAQQAKIKRIMDIQPDILLLTNGESLQSVNASFFKFFDTFHNLEQFLAKHSCICDFFEKVNEEGYIYDFNHENWIEVVYHQPKISKVKIQKDGVFYTFKVQVEKFDQNNYVVNLNDITQLQEYQKELESKRDNLITQLYTDSLTHLPNRIRLIEDIKTTSNPLVILININSFKEINDFYGVDIGDYVLIEFADMINQQLPSKRAKLYKMSGDEYIILDSFLSNRVELIRRLNRLSSYLNTQTIIKESYTIDITTTLGVAFESSDLLISADIALREAKNSKLRFAIYDKSFETLKQYQNNLLWSKKIKNALDNNHIVPYFQAIVDNQNDTIVKYESLVRLIEPDGEVITPFSFLHIAKRSHIYHNISKCMIEQSFEYFNRKNMSFSINLSIHDIENYETHQLILNKLQEYQLGERVTFEILESEGINNYDVVASFINEIKKYNALVAIDDFGTGYSNFSHIINLQIDYLKIDGSLINNILHDESVSVVVETIIAFAKKLGIKTIAEYVDSKELYEYVKKMGIDYSQGFYISQPISKILESDTFLQT